MDFLAGKGNLPTDTLERGAGIGTDQDRSARWTGSMGVSAKDQGGLKGNATEKSSSDA